MSPHSPTPDWAQSCMRRITKFDDPDLLDAVLDLVVGLSGLNVSDQERASFEHLALRTDAAQAALDFGYRQTGHCQRGEEEYLGIAV